MNLCVDLCIDICKDTRVHVRVDMRTDMRQACATHSRQLSPAALLSTPLRSACPPAMPNTRRAMHVAGARPAMARHGVILVTWLCMAGWLVRSTTGDCQCSETHPSCWELDHYCYEVAPASPVTL